MLITNKDKQSTNEETKTGTARYLRHTATSLQEALEVVDYRRKARDPRTVNGIAPCALPG
jgi:hypothetical protein